MSAIGKFLCLLTFLSFISVFTILFYYPVLFVVCFILFLSLLVTTLVWEHTHADG